MGVLCISIRTNDPLNLSFLPFWRAFPYVALLEFFLKKIVVKLFFSFPWNFRGARTIGEFGVGRATEAEIPETWARIVYGYSQWMKRRGHVGRVLRLSEGETFLLFSFFLFYRTFRVVFFSFPTLHSFFPFSSN